MKRKIIDDNTMEISMNKDDLRKYNVTVLDLLGDHHRIQHFFYNILRKVDTNQQFSTKNHLVFKILPNKNGLKLIVSKHPVNANLKFNSYRRDRLNQSNQSNQTLGNRDNVILLRTFEDFIKVAHVLRISNGFSNLYLFHRHYYLELGFYLPLNSLTIGQIKNKLSLAYEYGSQTRLTRSLLLKYGKRIMKGRALEIGRHYFK